MTEGTLTKMYKILVADTIAEEGLARLREAPQFAAEIRTGLAADELARIVGDYDGMIIRSSVQVGANILAKPGRLKVIARAGVGVDNVDVAAATAAGVLVINTPDANTVSTAEHTIAMMMSVLRRVPEAHAHVIGGGWERKKFVGQQAAGKVLGIVGLGRVGRAVAERALGLKMKVLAFDPLLSTDTAMEGRVQVLRTLDDLLTQIDCLTLHAAMTAESKGMIGAEQISHMKKSAVVINCARGGLVDEAALAESLNAGRLAGAAVDVFSAEPPKNNPLLSARNIVLTPHLGASTEEAQTAVSTEAVESLLDFLQNGVIRGAVNVAGLPAHLSVRDRAYLDLTGRMAAILAPLCGGGIDRVEVMTYGADAITALCPTLALQSVAELMSPHIEGRLNLVNAQSFAEQRGITVHHAAHSTKREFFEIVTIKIERRGEVHHVEGTVFLDGVPRILAIDGYRMEMVPEGLLVLIFNDDRPGVIGLVGTLFGNHQINIANMTLSRRAQTALMLLKIDGAVPESVLDELKRAEPILSVRTVQLPPLRKEEAT
jgi:D-3-phosphoglycerate dehydrogenase